MDGQESPDQELARQLVERAQSLVGGTDASPDPSCAGDTTLRAEVESLLAARRRARASTGSSDTDDAPLAPTDVSTARACGPYRLIEEIGHGGMGVVYRAVQEHPRREVAVKILRPGVIGPGGTRRFHREIDVLGQLEHTGIARIYEAGSTTIDGVERPYFAMELVRGRRLDDETITRASDLRSRLELFIGVGEAVQAAHDQGVVHRDLKPSNILVDESGAPKLIDFGVASRTERDIERSFQTGAGEIVGTLAFMAPEQLRGTAGVDTRADVYGLGAVLAVLLTGRPPLDLTDLALPAIAERIQHQMPDAPSRADSTLPRALDWIVLKALEKEPGRRYASAHEMVDDVQRFLRAEPVLAGPPSRLYRVSLFARRRRVECLALAAVLVAAMITYWVRSSSIASASELEGRLSTAETERAQIDASRDELLAVIQETTRRVANSQGGAHTTRQLVLAQMETLSAVGEADVLPVDTLLEVASALTVLGLFDDVDVLLSKANRQSAATFGTEDSRSVRLEVAGLQAWVRTVGRSFDRLAEVGEIADRARRVLGEAHRATIMARVVQHIALWNTAPNQAEAGLRALREELSSRRDDEGIVLYEEVTRELTRGLFDLGWQLGTRYAWEDVRSLMEEVYASRQQRLSVSDPLFLASQLDLANFLVRDGGDQTRALHVAELARSGFAGRFGDEHPDTVNALVVIARIEILMGDLDSGLAHLEKVVDDARKLLSGGWVLPDFLFELADTYSRAGRWIDQMNALAEQFHLLASRPQRRGHLLTYEMDASGSSRSDVLNHFAVGLAMHAANGGRFEEATGWIQVAMERAPASALCWLRAEVGWAAWFAGDHTMAEDSWHAVLASCPDDAHEQRDRSDHAAGRSPIFWQAREPGGAVGLARLGLARLARFQGRAEEAWAWARDWEGDDPTAADERLMAEAAELERRGCTDEALALTEEVVMRCAREPTDVYGRTRRYALVFSRRLAEAGQLDLADVFVQFAEQQQDKVLIPEDPERLVTQVAAARLAAMRGKNDEAGRLMDDVVARTPTWDARLPSRQALAEAWR